MILSFLFMLKLMEEKKKGHPVVCLSRFNSMVLMLENANQMVRFAQRGQYHEVNLKNKIELSVELC